MLLVLIISTEFSFFTFCLFLEVKKVMGCLQSILLVCLLSFVIFWVIVERQYGWDLISEQYVNRLSFYSESAMNQSLSSYSVTLQGAELSTSELSSNNDINQITRLQFLEGFGDQGINRNLFFVYYM